MSAFVHLIDQRRLIGPGGSTVSGEIFFYYTGTTTLAPVYQDATLLIPSPNPVVVGAGEVVPILFLDSDIVYRRVIEYSDGSFDEQDPMGQLFSEGSIGLPVGSIIDYPGAVAPDGYLMCYGQAISRTEYAELFTAIGTTYGAGNGTTTFNVPDARGRVAAGKDNMGGVAAGRLTSPVNGSLLGDADGDQSVVLGIANMPNHNHGGFTGSDGAHIHTTDYFLASDTGAQAGALVDPSGTRGTPVATSSDGSHTHTISSQGSGDAFSIIQPTIVFNKIIKAVEGSLISLIDLFPGFDGKANASAIGITPSASNMGAFTSPLLPDNATTKAVLEVVGTELEGRPTDAELAAAVAGLATDAELAAVATARPTFTDLAAGNGASLIGITKAGTGAVLRSLENSARDYQNTPYDFNAVGDGVYNNTTAFTNLVNAGRPIYAPDGIYNLGSSVTYSGRVSWKKDPDASFVGAGSITTPDCGGFFYFPNAKNMSMLESQGTPASPVTHNDAVAGIVKHTNAAYPGSGLAQPAFYVSHHKYMNGPLDRAMGIYSEAIDHAGSNLVDESYVEGGRFHGIQLGANGLAYGVIAYAQMGDGVTDPNGRYTIGIEADLARPLGSNPPDPPAWGSTDKLDVNFLATIRPSVQPMAGFMINPYNDTPAKTGFMVGNSLAATGVGGRNLITFASFCTIADNVPYGLFIRGSGMFAAISVQNNVPIVRALNAAGTNQDEIFRYDNTDSLIVGNDADRVITATPLHQRLQASVTPLINGEMTIQATSDTSLTIKYRGSDAVTRSVSLTLT